MNDRPQRSTLKLYSHSIFKVIKCTPVLALLAFVGAQYTSAAPLESKEKLGEHLYFEQDLSLNRSQSCATCHNPANGFVDQRDYQNPEHQKLNNAVSLGDDGHSFGDRQAPTASYANQIPAFYINKAGKYVGGQFWDGRASTLTDQAQGPPLNPIEMNMSSKTQIRERLLAKQVYRDSFVTLFGSPVLQDDESFFQAVAESIASFEQSDFFSPFDSKYDRYLRGEYQLSKDEELGMTLFFSQQFTNCNQCHQLHTSSTAAKETFSNYEYHNIGVPANLTVRQHNKAEAKYIDEGLLAHPDINDPAQKGKFKTPSLRNVAVTGPYMHNGVFSDLRTVVDFYNKYNSKSEKRQINPETGEKWREPEVAENISFEELESGPALNDKRISAIVAFLKTLTDQRYEKLLNDT